MNRRRFNFWVGMGLFWLGEKLHASVLDSAAASIMKSSDLPATDGATTGSATSISSAVESPRWSLDQNRTWQWYDRHEWIDDQWKLTGRTTPVNRETGELLEGGSGYLDESEVPEDVQHHASQLRKKLALGEADPERRARDGRPPSEWLRSLHADEIRIWLKTIDVPEFGVSGMTFWTHLTRDHSFSPTRIEGLTIAEQAKLHSAAHYGY